MTLDQVSVMTDTDGSVWVGWLMHGEPRLPGCAAPPQPHWLKLAEASSR